MKKTISLLALCGALALSTANSYAQNAGALPAPAAQAAPTDTFDPDKSPGVIVQPVEQVDQAPQQHQQAPVPQQAAPAAALPSTELVGDCAPNCEVKKPRKIIGYKEKLVRVPIYAKEKKAKHAKCEKNCSTPVETQPVKVTEPAPQTVYVKKRIVIVEVPEIVHAPTPKITVLQQRPSAFAERKPFVVAPQPPAQIRHKMVCCPPGVYIRGLPPCKPGQTTRTSAPGTPGGGYVRGAPRSPEECVARGGTDTGRGCDGFN